MHLFKFLHYMKLKSNRSPSFAMSGPKELKNKLACPCWAASHLGYRLSEDGRDTYRRSRDCKFLWSIVIGEKSIGRTSAVSPTVMKKTIPRHTKVFQLHQIGHDDGRIGRFIVTATIDRIVVARFFQWSSLLAIPLERPQRGSSAWVHIGLEVVVALPYLIFVIETSQPFWSGENSCRFISMGIVFGK